MPKRAPASRVTAPRRRGAWRAQARAARVHYNALATRRAPVATNERVAVARATHNFAKALLIDAVCARFERRVRVLELCGGRGGDVGKWLRQPNVASVDLVDVSDASLAEARRRYGADRRLGTHCADAFDDDALWPATVASFDVASCQFALHYAFETRERATAAVRQATRALAADGVFIGTVPHAERLCAAANDDDAVWRVSDVERDAFTRDFGGRYRFSFAGAVDAHDEYVVQRRSLESVLAAVGWRLVEYEPLDAYCARLAPAHDALRRAMRVPADARHYERVSSLYAVFSATRSGARASTSLSERHR